jgi:hypothetical protein
MSENTKNLKSLPWVHHYVKFSIFCGVFVLIPLLLSILVLSRSFSFVLGLSNPIAILSIGSIDTFLRLGFWLAFLFVFLGFYIIFIHFFSYFNFEIYSGQIRKFFTQPINKRVFYRMQLPQNFQYDTRLVCGLIKEFYFSFISKNITWSTVLNYGKYHHSACFDYIVENGVVKCYISFPFGKQVVAIEVFKKYFPQIELVMCKDPFGDMPKQWLEDDKAYKYDNMAGCVISHSMAAMFGSTENPTNDKNKYNISDFLSYLSQALPEDKIVLQYVYTFDSLIDPSYYDDKRDKLMEKTLEIYSPSNGKKTTDTDAFAVLLPSFQAKRLDDLNVRLDKDNEKFVRAGIKIVAFCNDKNYERTERALDKAIRAYMQENSNYASDNQLEKSYLTATNQTYFNHHKVYKDIDERARFMYERMVFLPTILEPYFASLYNKFYYPNENRWRRKNLYTCFKRRSGYKPLSDSLCLLDFGNIDRSFQIPVFKGKIQSNVIQRASSNM